ncbi:MAG TPA: OmpA family protein [Caulobacteraceae bacterium]|nr:OmpA family protein [Caulobacteraceae bacterium]
MRNARARAIAGVCIGAALALGGCQMGRKARGPLVASPPACADFNISIYFDAGSARLTREAGDLIRLAAGRTTGCAVTNVDVIGLADAPGDPDANLQLSKRRADVVRQALARRGIASVKFAVAAAGDVGAQTPVGQARPLRRRADVLFHVSPKS